MPRGTALRPDANPTDTSRPRDPLELAMLNDGILALDRSSHIPSLGEWCDCWRCVQAREAERAWEAARAARYDRLPRTRDPVEAVPLGAARERAMPHAQDIAEMTLHGSELQGATILGVDLAKPGDDCTVYLGDFHGQVAPQPLPTWRFVPEPPRRSWLARLLAWLGVGR